jgi:hypothetical protein
VGWVQRWGGWKNYCSGRTCVCSRSGTLYGGEEGGWGRHAGYAAAGEGEAGVIRVDDFGK